MTDANIKKIEETVWNVLKNHSTPNVCNFAMVKVRKFLAENQTPTNDEIVAATVDAVMNEGMTTDTRQRAMMVPDEFDPNAGLVEIRSELYRLLKTF